MKTGPNILLAWAVVVAGCYDARGLAIRAADDNESQESTQKAMPSRLDAGVLVDAASAGNPDASLPAVESDAGVPEIQPCSFELTVHTPRIDPRDTWSASDLNRLMTCIEENPSEQATFVEQFWVSHLSYGGSPIWDGSTAIILQRGNVKGLSVSGSFDNWPEDQGRVFSTIGNSDLSFVRIPLDRGGRYQYKLLRIREGEKTWTMDRANRWIVWDGFDQGTIGNFNNEILGPGHRLDRSLLYRFEIEARDIYIYLPPEYFSGRNIEKILYLNDGNEYLTRAGVQTIIDDTIASARVSPMLGVFIGLESQNDRIAEYTYGSGQNGDAYVDALALDWAPRIEQYFGVNINASERGIAGASLGGLISFYAAIKHNHVFQKIAAQSGSFWYGEGDMISRIETGSEMAGRFYLDSGSPADNSESTRQMVSALQARGYDYHHIEEEGGEHEWAYWAGRFDDMLEHLFQ